MLLVMITRQNFIYQKLDKTKLKSYPLISIKVQVSIKFKTKKLSVPYPLSRMSEQQLQVRSFKKENYPLILHSLIF